MYFLHYLSVEHSKIRSHLQHSQSTPNTLDLSSQALPAHHLKPLFLALQCQYSLRKLLLPGNRISDDAVPPLTAALKSLPNLAVLDLSCNGISQEGLKLLQEGLNKSVNGGVLMGSAVQGESNPKPLQVHVDNVKKKKTYSNFWQKAFLLCHL